jgi:phosphomannomutase
MDVKFGTSGLRGLVVDLTDTVVTDHVAAFLSACPHGGAVYLGRDLRASSPRIADAVARAVAGAGLALKDCGVLPTPALALAAGKPGAAAIMVTGSHIPDDRNGLKFYTPAGEISKTDEAAILSALGSAVTLADADPEPVDALAAYAARYLDGFGEDALSGLRIGVYQHSSVARDVMNDVVSALGGTPVPLGRAERFVPVDTEAVDPETRTMLADWCAEHGLDAVISTDGDADRPMVTDASGTIVPGDVLGALTARALGANTVVTPVSSNTLVDALPGLHVVRTRIGSPFVIAGIESVLADDPAARVVGYEANGGFLLGFDAQGPAGPLAPLLTRDCLLPILAPLAAARSAGQTLAQAVAGLPARFTAADRVAGVPSDRSAAFIAGLTENPAHRAAFFDVAAAEQSLDLTDGLRVSFANGSIVHLRPSGNAPECRCYAEADSSAEAEALVTRHLAKLAAALS